MTDGFRRENQTEHKLSETVLAKCYLDAIVVGLTFLTQEKNSILNKDTLFLSVLHGMLAPEGYNINVSL